MKEDYMREMVKLKQFDILLMCVAKDKGLPNKELNVKQKEVFGAVHGLFPNIDVADTNYRDFASKVREFRG